VKRFWDTVTLSRADAGYTVMLDGKPMNLPTGTRLVVGPHALAEAIATEWRDAGGGKGGQMSFADTPLTRLAGTAQERIAPDPLPTADAIARYGESDLLCYRAPAPKPLTERQTRDWQPWLDWAASTYGAPLRVGEGVGYVRQHKDSLAALRRAVLGMDAYALAGLGIAVPSLGSLVLGLALAEGALDAARAHELGALEELFEVEQWGEDYEGLDRRNSVGRDVALAERFIRLSRG
jgi:chaperone required for assembly of F1-ATPase